MAIKTQTMTSCFQDTNFTRIAETNSNLKTHFFSVIAIEQVEILFEIKIDKINSLIESI